MGEKLATFLRTNASRLRAIPGRRWFKPAAGVLLGLSLFFVGFYLGLRSIPVTHVPAPATAPTGPVSLQDAPAGPEQETDSGAPPGGTGSCPEETTGPAEQTVTYTVPEQSGDTRVSSKTADEVLSEMVLPLEGETLRTQGWSYWPSFSEWRYHEGVDIGAAAGEPVRSALSGTVTEVRTDIRLGTVIVVSHDAGVVTVYGCVKPAEGIRPGKHLERGQVIGGVSDSGPCEGDSEPHLHFEVRCGDVLLDPASYLDIR